ncbi:MAG TPA: hypothetical protein VHF45_00025 [Thermoleophilaceae bacterium]|nr:hypothetical protein [Thermoleophilaceae bacterium]
MTRTQSGAELGPLEEAAGLSIGVVLAALAGIRRGKAFHPDGVVYGARLEVVGAPAAPQGAELLSQPGDHHAVARFSRAVGVPRPIPDLLGLSIRLPNVYGAGRHQDFLLVTSADYPLLHHIFLPAVDTQQRPYTSSLPYRAGSELFLVGALPQPGSPRPPGRDEFERLEAAAATGRLSFWVAVASMTGRFRPVGTLHVGRRLGRELDALRFNPWNTGGGMRPAGWLNGARDRAYKLSQAAWRRTRRDGARAQDAADRQLERLGPTTTVP